MNKTGAVCISIFAILLVMYPMFYNYLLYDPHRPTIGDPQDLTFKMYIDAHVPTAYVKESGPLIIKFSLCNEGLLPVRVPKYSGIGITIDIGLTNSSHDIVFIYPRAKMARGAELLYQCQETSVDVSQISGYYTIINSAGKEQRMPFSWDIPGLYSLKSVYRLYEPGRDIDSNDLYIRIVDSD
jgi:hypothetical protein